MEILWVIAILPLALAAGAAVAGWIIAGSRHVMARGAVRVLIIAAMNAATLVMTSYWLVTVNPWMVPFASEGLATLLNDVRFALPLVVGSVALVILAFPTGAIGSRGVGAELSRRTPLTFSSTSWLLGFAAVLLLTVAVTFAAGMASSPDEQGRYTQYYVEVGQVTGSTEMYGWHYSTPCLILLAILVGIMALDLFLLARPPQSLNRDADVAVRRLRSLNVARVGSGAVLLHLSAVLLSLAGTSTLSTGFGSVMVGSSFAALTQFLYFAGGVIGVAGLALWFSTLLSTVPAFTSVAHRVRAA